METLVIGIDVSQNQLDVAYWNGHQSQFLSVFENSDAGLTALNQAITALAASPYQGKILLVVEPTGGYEQLAARWALTEGWQVALPNPKQVRDWAKGVGFRAKTDKQDALMLAAYGAMVRPTGWQPPQQSIEVLSHLIDRLMDLETMLRMEQNRLHALSHQPLAAQATQESLHHSINFFNQQIQQLQTAIADHFNQNPSLHAQADCLQSIPGIGAKNVQFLLCTLHRFHRLTQGAGTAKQLTAFVGLDPVTYQSGTSVRKPSAISKAGDGVLRRYLFLGALGGRRGKNPLADFYQRLVDRGKPKMVALVACARKMLVWAWACFVHKTPFDPSRACPSSS